MRARVVAVDDPAANAVAGYNTKMNAFVQSYENNTILDSSILIAPLVFFISPCDPRFVNTLDRILLPPDKGGLTSAGLVFRYDTELSDDGVLHIITILCWIVLTRFYRCWWTRRRLQHVHVLAG